METNITKPAQLMLIAAYNDILVQCCAGPHPSLA